jgi:hypothetical protein
MLTEQEILIARLKDSDVKLLYDDMMKELKPLYDEQRVVFNQKVYDYLKRNLKYFSTTEIRAAFNRFEDECFTQHLNYPFLNSLDEWLKLDQLDESMADIIIRQKIQQAHSVLNKVQPILNNLYRGQGGMGKSYTYTKNNHRINRILNIRLHRQDPRKLRRQARIEKKNAKLKKRGVKLYV